MASVVLSFGGKEVKTYEIDKPAIVVGRDPGADICIDNLGVSRSHCQFLQRGGAFLVQDMNSANGTYVNGKRVGEHNLNDNDQIVVGKYALTFKGEGAAAPAAPAGAPAGAAPAADRIVPDSLNTYMMDGDKIKERLEEMRREEEAKASAPAAAPSPAQAAPEQPVSAPAAPAAPAAPPPPAEAATERPERHHTRIVMGAAKRGPNPRTIKLYLYASLALNILLAVALFLYMLHVTGLTK